MLRKDYIINQFEEFGKVLALILSFKRQKDWESFEKEIKNAASKYTPYEIIQLEDMNDTEFDEQLLQSTELSQAQKKIVASLLFEKMNYYSEINNEEKQRNTHAKCLKLYEHINSNFTNNEFDLDVHYKLDFLKRS